MGNRTFIRPSGTSMAVLGLAILATVACGAAGGKGQKGGGKKGPLEPTTYDPQVSLAPLVDKVSPAVVNIKTETKVRVPGFMGPDNLFEFFFGPRSNRPSPFQRREREQTRQAAGSGFIVDRDGLVVTNHHVVSGADEIEVQLSDHRAFDAVLVGSDERTDVALLRLKDAKKLPVVEFGDSDVLRVGDRVVAIGNPFGLDHTVTTGIVSAKERVIGAGPYDDFIQTDASINPGNSGGPLFNLRGEVIGINTAIVPRGQGIGFAIPSNLARQMIESLRSDGTVVRGWLGIVPQPLDERLAEAFGMKEPAGALVANVQPGSPADEAGIEAGDVIVQIGKKKLEEARDIYGIIANLKPGKTIDFKVVREGKRRKISVKIGQRPDEGAAGTADDGGGAKAPAGELGVSVGELTDSMRSRLGAGQVKSGVVVTRVDPDSRLGSSVTEGDIIVEVNRVPVGSVAEFDKALSDLEKGDDVLLLLFRRGAWIYKVVRL